VTITNKTQQFLYMQTYPMYPFVRDSPAAIQIKKKLNTNLTHYLYDAQPSAKRLSCDRMSYKES